MENRISACRRGPKPRSAGLSQHQQATCIRSAPQPLWALSLDLQMGGRASDPPNKRTRLDRLASEMKNEIAAAVHSFDQKHDDERKNEFVRPVEKYFSVRWLLCVYAWSGWASFSVRFHFKE